MKPEPFKATTFDAVLKRINYNEVKIPLLAGQQLFIVDPDSGEVFEDRLPFFKRFRAKRFRYYVGTINGKAICPRSETTILDSSGRKRAIAFTLEVQGIATGQMSKTVAALSKENTPFEGLVEHMGRWLQEIIDHQHAAKVYPLVRLSETLKTTCGTFITERAEKQIGLIMKCTLRLPEEDLKLPDFDLKIKALVKDVEDQFEVRLELKIEPPSTPEKCQEALAHLLPVDELKEQIELRAKQWFREHCSLEQFCYQPIYVRDELQKTSRNFIENDLRLRLFSLRVTPLSKFDFATVFPQEIDLTVESTIEPAQTKIQVHHKLLLKRENIAVLRNLGITDFEAKIKELLQVHTRGLFFGKKYVEVIVGFEELRAEIRKRVSKDVQELGFVATQLITIPNEEQMQRILGGSFSFDTSLPDQFPEGGKKNGGGMVEKPVCVFSTKDSRVNFGLSIQARVRLDDLNLVKSFLHPKTDLRDNFKAETREAAAEVIRTLTPQELYMEFSGSLSQDGEVSSGPLQTPEIKIRNAITERLHKSFNAVVENITLTTEATELTELYSAIRPAASHRFDLSFNTLGKTGEKFTYHIDYRILSITANGWRVFQECSNNTSAKEVGKKAEEIVNALNQFLTSKIMEKLQLIPPDLLRSTHPFLLQRISEIYNKAIDGVREHFGFEIEFVGRFRELTGWELSEQETAKEAHAALKRQLKALEDKYETLQADLPPDDPALKDLILKIEECRNKLKEFAPDHNEHFDKVKIGLAQLHEVGLHHYLPPPSEKQVPPDSQKPY